MATKPTISDVAARAGVSKGAASFALNGKAGVSAETRDRVLRVADELGFAPSATAKALATKRSDTLGLILARDPETLGSDPFFAPFIAGVETVLAPKNRSLTLRFVTTEQEQAAYLDAARAHRMDGVILSDLRVDDPRPAWLASVGLPYVSLNRPDVDSVGPAICLDDLAGIRSAVAHLVRLGHRHIAHVGGPTEYLHANDRRDAWAEELTSVGGVSIPALTTDFTARGGAAATEELLAHDPPPTAILYSNDLMAMAGLAVAQRLGLDVPGDLSMIGYDDAELAAHVHPALSTVRTDALGWGRAAAYTLLEVLDGKSVTDVHLPAALFIDRESTAPPRGTS